jgi:hypothetical protein
MKQRSKYDDNTKVSISLIGNIEQRTVNIIGKNNSQIKFFLYLDIEFIAAAYLS